MKHVGYAALWLAIVMVFGLVMGAVWDQFMQATAALPYANPLRIMCIGILAGGFAFWLNRSQVVQLAVPSSMRISSTIIFGSASIMMGWACAYSAFPSGEPLSDVGIRTLCAVVAFVVGFFAFQETRKAIKHAFV